MMWYYGPGAGMPWWMYLTGALFMLVFWGGLIAVVVWVIGQFRSTSRARDASNRTDAVEILKERFARGEINQQEYEQRRALLQQ